jgi:hypothetical protein
MTKLLLLAARLKKLAIDPGLKKIMERQERERKKDPAYGIPSDLKHRPWESPAEGGTPGSAFSDADIEQLKERVEGVLSLTREAFKGTDPALVYRKKMLFGAIKALEKTSKLIEWGLRGERVP